MKVRLIKRTGESKKISVVFSIGYFFLGPLYYLFNKMFFKFLFLTAIYTFGIWKQSGQYLINFLVDLGLKSKNVAFLNIPSQNYWITIGFLVGFHIVMSFITPKTIIERLLRKKGYVPYSEIDAQLLVKYSLARVGTVPYLASFKPVNGVQGKIKIENTEELNKKLDELAQLLKEGMITKDEYNTKRAQALMNVTIKK